jgi:hypothetical protein
MTAPLVYSDDVVAFARRFLFVREAGANAGQRVEAIQRWCGGMKGDSWCCYFATMVLDIVFQGQSPVPRNGVCQNVYELAKQKGWVTNTPHVGDFYLYVNEADHAHHIGFVTGVNPLTGISGNTSSDGTSNNGDGVHEHAISAHVFIHYDRADSLAGIGGG